MQCCNETLTILSYNDTRKRAPFGGLNAQEKDMSDKNGANGLMHGEFHEPVFGPQKRPLGTSNDPRKAILSAVRAALNGIGTPADVEQVAAAYDTSATTKITGALREVIEADEAALSTAGLEKAVYKAILGKNEEERTHAYSHLSQIIRERVAVLHMDAQGKVVTLVESLLASDVTERLLYDAIKQIVKVDGSEQENENGPKKVTPVKVEDPASIESAYAVLLEKLDSALKLNAPRDKALVLVVERDRPDILQALFPRQISPQNMAALLKKSGLNPGEEAIREKTLHYLLSSSSFKEFFSRKSGQALFRDILKKTAASSLDKVGVITTVMDSLLETATSGEPEVFQAYKHSMQHENLSLTERVSATSTLVETIKTFRFSTNEAEHGKIWAVIRDGALSPLDKSRELEKVVREVLKAGHSADVDALIAQRGIAPGNTDAVVGAVMEKANSIIMLRSIRNVADTALSHLAAGKNQGASNTENFSALLPLATRAQTASYLESIGSKMPESILEADRFCGKVKLLCERLPNEDPVQIITNMRSQCLKEQDDLKLLVEAAKKPVKLAEMSGEELTRRLYILKINANENPRAAMNRLEAVGTRLDRELKGTLEQKSVESEWRVRVSAPSGGPSQGTTRSH